MRSDSNARLRAGDPVLHHNVSPEGRRAMSEAGKRSLPALLKANSIPSVADNEATAKEVDKLIAAAIAELGGEESLTARQRHLLASQRLLLFTVLAGTDCLSRSGIANRHGKPRALLNVLAAYVNSLRLNLEALNLAGERPHEAGRRSFEDALAAVAAEKGGQHVEPTED